MEFKTSYNIEQRIVQLEKLKRDVARWRFLRKKIVFTNGCFDILHLGHINYLSEAADLGDILIVGLNSDKSVKALKGDKRPFNNQDARAKLLASLFFIDAVTIFDQDNPEELIKEINPDVLVKGGDYSIAEIAGSDFVLKNGGEVKTIPITEGYSTTNILQNHKK
jgi:rfaE bifunctional protein nucleotidyltransferase chain/domain